jgi:hypothetical protein
MVSVRDGFGANNIVNGNVEACVAVQVEEEKLKTRPWEHIDG